MDFIPLKSSLPHRGTFEWPMILISIILSGIGLGLVYSATAQLGEAGRLYVMRQITWCSLGLVLAAALLIFDYELLDHWALRLYVLIIVALIIVWATGKVTYGSKRWIQMGLMRFQPSEFAKLAVIIVLAKYLQTAPGNASTQLMDVLRPLALAVVPALLVLLQPDLGTACVIALIASSMIIFAGAGKRLLLWTGIGLVALIPIAIFLGDHLLMSYQKRRLFSFLNPSYDPLGSGYHLLQSQIAIGSGGLFGKGFLQGTQNQLMFLPVKHTDFIFAILAEEWGFVGCAVVLILFLALFLRGMTIAGKARDNFGTLLAFGCTVSFFWHVTINVGMVMGLLPVVGVPLSFLSYGGSAILSSFLAVSILSNVAMRRSAY
jgi:rod shape determining protein RodA